VKYQLSKAVWEALAISRSWELEEDGAIAVVTCREVRGRQGNRSSMQMVPQEEERVAMKRFAEIRDA
jgi:hypothetical protein